MSELRSNSTSETYGFSPEASSLVPGAEIDLHKSKLPTKETGLRFALEARAAIEAALAENPRPLSREQLAREGARSIGQVGARTTYFRRQATEEPISEEEHFRLWEHQVNNPPAESTTNFDYEQTGSRRG